MSETLPQEIRQQYAVSEAATVRELDGGSVNKTVLVSDGGEQSIIQQVSPYYESLAPKDAQLVARHLSEHGWEAPLSRQTTIGETNYRDSLGRLWRSTVAIANDGTPRTNTVETSAAAGALLGRWHTNMHSFTTPLRSAKPRVFDGDHHMTILAQRHAGLPMQAQQIGRALLLERQPTTLSSGNHQVIHGDPKIDNMLFRGSKPFTLIDFDTLMHASPLADVGDFLRSLSGKLLRKQISAAAHFDSFLGQYHHEADTGVSLDELHGKARTATAEVARTLAARYLADINAKEHYFSYDESCGQTRAEYLSQKAHDMLRVARGLEKELQLAS